MAYVNVAEWKPEQVTEWLKGLENTVMQYVQSFLNNEVNGQQLLNLRPDDLNHLGVQKLGHQELILEAVEHLRNFHYELDRENLQLLALQLACRAHSLQNEMKRRSDLQRLSTQTLADVAYVIMAVKPLVCWLDRSPFSGLFNYQDCKDNLLHLSLQIATCAQRDRFAEKPVEEVRSICKKLAELGDEIIQDIVDPLILQPASLDLVTLKKRASDDLGFFILPSFHGDHQIAEINFSSPAHQCGKIENGDEIVQVNYQTVVGWQTKKVMELFEESPTEVFLTLKKRPRHTKVYGQIYMKPYRLPSKKRSAPYSRWNDNLPSPRPELLTIPNFELPLLKGISKKGLPQSHHNFDCISAFSTLTPEVKKKDDLEYKFERKCADDVDGEQDDDDDEDDDDSFLPETVDDEGHASPTSMRLYLPKPRVTVQRRATVTGASPISKRPPVNVEQFWAELRIERHWRDCGVTDGEDKETGDLYQLRDKSASVGNGLSSSFSRPCTTLGIETVVSKIKYSQKHNYEYVKKAVKTMQTINAEACITDQCVADSCDNNSNFSYEKHTMENMSLDEKNVQSGCNEIQSNSGKCASIFMSHDKSSCAASQEIHTDYVCEGSNVNEMPDLDLSAINIPVIDQFSSQTESNNSVVLENSTVENNKMLNENEGSVNILQSNCFDIFCENIHECTDNKYICDQGKNISSSRERGKLDKSHSTPAYDLLESITFLEKNVILHSDEIKLENVGNKLTEVNLCILQTQNEVKPSDSDSLQTLLGDDFNSGDIVECRNTCTEYDNFASYVDRTSGPRSSPLCNEEFRDRCTSSQPTNSLVENLFLGNKPSNSPWKSGQKVLNENALYSQVDTDFYSTVKSAENVSKSYCTPVTNVPEITVSSGARIKYLDPLSHNHSENNLSTPDYIANAKRTPQTYSTFETSKWPVKNVPTCTAGTSLGVRSVSSNSAIQAFPVTSFSSPRSSRKLNALLTKRRKISVKDIGTGDFEGWLLHRFRSSGASATWLKVWFILKGIIFYGFKTQRANKAHIMIVLPGFTVCVAEEVKSRSFAFKIYHTGTVFYFAAETANEFRIWLECLSLATTSQNLVKMVTHINSQSICYSETDEDSDSEKNSDSETSKVYQSPRIQSKKTDSHKLFGSLKKIVSKTESNGLTTHLEFTEPSSSSLDRKYLNFLGGIRNGNNVPVPTAQFRSYRRASRKTPVNRCELDGGKSNMPCEEVLSASLNDKIVYQDSLSDFKCISLGNESTLLSAQDFTFTDRIKSSDSSGVSVDAANSFATNHITDISLTVENKDSAILQCHKLLKVHGVRDHQIHASSPALQLSSDMLNYCLAAERLRKFGLSRNQQEDTSGFVTLEKLMLSHQEVEKHKQHANGNSASSCCSASVSQHNHLDTAYAGMGRNNEHTLLEMEGGGSSSVLSETKLHYGKPAIPVSKNGNFINILQSSNMSQNIRTSSSNKPSNSTLMQNNALAKQKVLSRLETNAAISSSKRCSNLKTAAQYQPPPISQVLASGRKVYPREDGPKMKLAFEMHLGEGKFSTPSHKDKFSKSSKLRNLFLFTKNQNVKCSYGDASVSNSEESHKPLTGLPKVHRTFPWEKQTFRSKNSSNKINNFNSATYPASSGVQTGWTADLTSHQSECSLLQTKPMMGVAMICKKPCRVVMTASSSSQNNLPSDYPDLEYPPVFEPETYTLSDASTLLKSRHHSCTDNKLCTCSSTIGSNQTKN